jgi:hypothetical protein
MIKTKRKRRRSMGHRRKCHTTLCFHVAGIAAAIALVCFMTKTKKGRRLTKKAKRIAGEVEDLVKDELRM